MNLDTARSQMIKQQVRAWDVLDPVILEVLGDIPRETFVPEPYRQLAFADCEIPLPHNETMLTPQVEGKLMQALEITPDDQVLEIGTGSGFLTACLAQLGKFVTSIDIHGDFVAAAADKLKAHNIDNVELASMDATLELPPGQFDVIAVSGSVPIYDRRYAQALKPGGRLFIVVGEAPVMDARLITRISDLEWRPESLFETSLGPLRNAAVPTPFKF